MLLYSVGNRCPCVIYCAPTQYIIKSRVDRPTCVSASLPFRLPPLPAAKMLLQHSHLVLGLSASLAWAQNIVPFPSNVEIDVIFPRNDTYDHAEVFPVVFAIQGAKAAWDFQFHFEWDINYADGYASDGLVEFGRAGNIFDGVPAPSDPFIVTNRSISMYKASGDHKYRLSWEFGFYTNCTDHGSSFEIESRAFNARGSLVFTVKSGAKKPDIAEPGPCPLLGSVVGMQGNSSGGCVHVGDSGISANPCAVTVNAAMASSVTSVIGTTNSYPSFTRTTTTSMTPGASGATPTGTAGGRASGNGAARPGMDVAAVIGLAALLV